MVSVVYNGVVEYTGEVGGRSVGFAVGGTG